MTNKKNISWIYNNTKGLRIFLFILSAGVIVSALADLFIAFILKMFIDVSTGESAFSLKYVITVTLITLLLQGCFEIICSYSRSAFLAKFDLNLRLKLMDHILHGKYLSIEKIHTAELITKLTDDINAISNLFPNIIINIGGNITIALSAIISLFFLSPTIAIVILISMPVLIIVLSLFNSPIEKADLQKKDYEEKYRIQMQEYISKIKTIKIYNIQKRCLSNMSESYSPLFKSRLNFSLWEGIASFFNNLIGNAMILITLGVGSYLIIIGETSLGSLVAIIQLLNFIINPFANISSALSQIAQANASVDRINTLLLLPQEETLPSPDTNPLSFTTLELRDICFSRENKCILKKTNYIFEKNKIYCITGENGSGKTTLLNLISGLYPSTQGSILLLNNDLEIPDYKQHVSLLPANETLFNTTLMNNITLFEKKCNKYLLEEIEKSTNLSNLIESLSNGYDTAISENGKSVSSGQAQLISLCRALYHQTGIILFDEPTSNLDADSIRNFKDLLNTIKKDRIIIIVSHEPDIASFCDYCVDIDDLQNTANS